MSEKRVLTIERSKWRRGGEAFNPTHGDTALLNDKGLMCCLGFDALACGVPESALRCNGEPDNIDNLEKYPQYADSPRFEHDQDDESHYFYQTKSINQAIKHNDDYTLSDARREALIRKDLMPLGWDDVVFV